MLLATCCWFHPNYSKHFFSSPKLSRLSLGMVASVSFSVTTCVRTLSHCGNATSIRLIYRLVCQFGCWMIFLLRAWTRSHVKGPSCSAFGFYCVSIRIWRALRLDGCWKGRQQVPLLWWNHCCSTAVKWTKKLHCWGLQWWRKQAVLLPVLYFEALHHILQACLECQQRTSGELRPTVITASVLCTCFCA